MRKNLTIIGGGFSAWVAASVFADNGYSIDIFEGKNKSFGSQQITPNGWKALSILWSNPNGVPLIELAKSNEGIKVKHSNVILDFIFFYLFIHNCYSI